MDLTYLSEIQPSGTKDEGDEKSGEGPKEPKTAFDQLVLPDGHKDVILSLVTQHFRDKELAVNNDQGDIVRGKGGAPALMLA